MNNPSNIPCENCLILCICISTMKSFLFIDNENEPLNEYYFNSILCYIDFEEFTKKLFLTCGLLRDFIINDHNNKVSKFYIDILRKEFEESKK